MEVIFSFDDGVEQDKKAIKLLKQYGIKEAIFFIPIHSWGMLYPETYNDYKVGGHTITHPSDLKQLTDEELDKEIKESRKKLGEQFLYSIDWFCYPRGRYNPNIIAKVKEAGFKWARTTKIGIGGSDYELKGFHMFARKEYQGIDWLDYIEKVLNQHKNSNATIHIWCHSWEIDKFNEWNKFEELLDLVNKLTFEV